ncbi:MAG: helix-turn-helix domain-containing protein [Solirubrobacteraceae bacterium]
MNTKTDEPSGIPDSGRAERSLGDHLASQVRLLRRQRGWSLERLGQACGVSRSMLSQIERNDANPTVAVALAIASALGVTLDELATPAAAGVPLQVVRFDDPHMVYRSDESCRIRTLSPLTPDRAIEFYEITLRPGGELRSAPHFAGTRELLNVLRGRVRVESAAHSQTLRTHDSAAYPADVEHAIINLGRGEAIVHLIDVTRTDPDGHST